MEMPFHRRGHFASPRLSRPAARLAPQVTPAQKREIDRQFQITSKMRQEYYQMRLTRESLKQELERRRMQLIALGGDLDGISSDNAGNAGERAIGEKQRVIEETEERHREAKQYEATLNMMLERYAMGKVQEESIFKVGKALPVCWLAPVERGRWRWR